MIYRAALVLGAWTATAAAAVVAGLAAVSVLGEGITDQTTKPMTAAQVRDELAEPAPTSSSPAPVSPSPTGARRKPKATAEDPAKTVTPSPTGITRILNSRGGSVLARCVNDTAYLVSWTPLQGYSADAARRGPAPTVSVEFQSGDRRIAVIVSCSGGQPFAAVHGDGRQWHDFHDDEEDHR